MIDHIAKGNQQKVTKTRNIGFMKLKWICEIANDLAAQGKALCWVIFQLDRCSL